MQIDETSEGEMEIEGEQFIEKQRELTVKCRPDNCRLKDAAYIFVHDSDFNLINERHNSDGIPLSLVVNGKSANQGEVEPGEVQMTNFAMEKLRADSGSKMKISQLHSISYRGASYVFVKIVEARDICEDGRKIWRDVNSFLPSQIKKLVDEIHEYILSKDTSVVLDETRQIQTIIIERMDQSTESETPCMVTIKIVGIKMIKPEKWMSFGFVTTSTQVYCEDVATAHNFLDQKWEVNQYFIKQKEMSRKRSCISGRPYMSFGLCRNSTNLHNPLYPFQRDQLINERTLLNSFVQEINQALNLPIQQLIGSAPLLVRAVDEVIEDTNYPNVLNSTHPQMTVLKCPILKYPFSSARPRIKSSNSHPQMPHPQVPVLNCRHTNFSTTI
uniref:Uncharacterized protein n=1 Tax=Acrobeloides nanus TaxID=290746 RepID=A0A914D981_9BILA